MQNVGNSYLYIMFSPTELVIPHFIFKNSLRQMPILPQCSYGPDLDYAVLMTNITEYRLRIKKKLLQNIFFSKF